MSVFIEHVTVQLPAVPCFIEIIATSFHYACAHVAVKHKFYHSLPLYHIPGFSGSDFNLVVW